MLILLSFRTWSVHKNETSRKCSPTGPFRRHLEDCHRLAWVQECTKLGILIKDQSTPDTPRSKPEQFTREGLLRLMIKFVTSNDQVYLFLWFTPGHHSLTKSQSLNLVENPIFRELLIYVGGGKCTEEDIPHRTKLTAEIIEAWKEERRQFSNEMKVCLICVPSCSNLYNLWFHDRMPSGGYH